MLEILILSILLLGIAIAGFSIKLLFDKKAVFKGGSCTASADELKERGISCGCGGGHCVTNE